MNERSVQGGADCGDNTIMLALSIRQPYAELILRGVKTAELRSRGRDEREGMLPRPRHATRVAVGSATTLSEG
jgi:hypothetical protein